MVLTLTDAQARDLLFALQQLEEANTNSAIADKDRLMTDSQGETVDAVIWMLQSNPD